MRTPMLAAVLGLSLAGCVVGDLGPGPGDDDGTGSNPGGGSNPTPKLDVSVDKATLSTELFSGTVTLAATAVDGAGAPLPAWDVTLDRTSIDMVADGTTTAVATLKIPSNANALAGTVKINATSSLGGHATQSTVTVAKQVSL